MSDLAVLPGSAAEAKLRAYAEVYEHPLVSIHQNGLLRTVECVEAALTAAEARGRQQAEQRVAALTQALKDARATLQTASVYEEVAVNDALSILDAVLTETP